MINEKDSLDFVSKNSVESAWVAQLVNRLFISA